MVAPAQPGAGPQNARRQRRKSRYGIQLEEKQNLKNIFGIRERQLVKYYREAKRSNEVTGLCLVKLLELRLDNAVYRCGMGETRPQSRQMVSHAIFEVNGRSVDVPSYRLKIGDLVMVKESKRTKPLFTNFVKKMENKQLPTWLELAEGAFGFKVVALPNEEEARLGVETQAIIEYLAR